MPEIQTRWKLAAEKYTAAKSAEILRAKAVHCLPQPNSQAEAEVKIWAVRLCNELLSGSHLEMLLASGRRVVIASRAAGSLREVYYLGRSGFKVSIEPTSFPLEVEPWMAEPGREIAGTSPIMVTTAAIIRAAGEFGYPSPLSPDQVLPFILDGLDQIGSEAK